MITIEELKEVLTEIRFNDMDEFVRRCMVYAKGAEGDETIPIEVIEDVGVSMMRYESRKLLLNKLGYAI